MKKQLFLTVIILSAALAPTAFAQNNPGPQTGPQRGGGFAGIFQDIKIGLQSFTGHKPLSPVNPTEADFRVLASTTGMGGPATSSSTPFRRDIPNIPRGDGRGDTSGMMGTTTRMHMIEDMRMMLTFRMDTVRINATIVRLQELVTKLNSRIEKIAAGGANVTVAQTDSTAAGTALTLATTDMTNVKNLIASIATSTPIDTTATSTIKADMTDAQTQIQTAQKDIEQAVISLIPLQGSAYSSTTITH